MKEFLTFLPASAADTVPCDQDAYIKDDIYLSGFKEACYQDMCFDVSVDGELYNETEIAQLLKKGGFSSAANLEELFLHAYLMWGMDTMKYLEGAYSFTIRKGRTIITIKDPMGLTPIFYTQNEHGIWISNSIETLLKKSSTNAVVDRKHIIELFAFGPGISESETLFENIKALPMGSMLSVRHQEIKVERYYELKAKQHEDDLHTTIQKVHDLVHDSIMKQMKDCNASFLSGGLDSSIITAVCAKNQKDWRTYSLDYEGNAENFKGNMFQVSLDQEFIDEMIRYCDCDHTVLTITQRELCEHLEDAMKARNMPGMADVDSSLLWLCEQVSQHEDIILSGECSDELMGGYPWFYRDEFKDVHTFPWLRYSEQRTRLLHKNLRDFDYQGYINQRYEETLSSVDTLDSDNEEDRRARINTVLVLHWFMQTLVTRQVCEGDRANLKIRAPFANVKLLEYVYNIPWSMKFLDEEEKGILRKAFEDELPDCVAHRKKNPFPKTHNPVYASMIAKKLKERFDDPDSALHILFDDDALYELIETKGASYDLPFYGQLMSGPQLLAYIYQIDCWIKDYHVEIRI